MTPPGSSETATPAYWSRWAFVEPAQLAEERRFWYKQGLMDAVDYIYFWATAEQNRPTKEGLLCAKGMRGEPVWGEKERQMQRECYGRKDGNHDRE